MKMIPIAAAIAAGTLAFAGAVCAQSTSGSPSAAPGSTGATSSQYDQQTPTPDNQQQNNGTMTPDTSGSTVNTPSSAMPAEVVPSSPSASPNAAPSYSTGESNIQTRSEVKAEAQAAVRAGQFSHGDAPTYPLNAY